MLYILAHAHYTCVHNFVTDAATTGGQNVKIKKK